MKKTNFVMGALALIMASALVLTGCNPQVTETPSGSGDVNGTTTCTVTFETDGGSAIDAVTVEKGNTVEKPADPTKEGYTFGTWYNGDDEYDFAEPVTTDLTLKATWSETVYSISYDVGEGKNAETNPSSYTINSDDITLADPTGSEATPNFVAWHTTAKPEEGEWENKVSGVAIAKGSTGNKAFYAEFSAKKVYTVTYKDADDNVLSTENFIEDSAITKPTIAGKTVDGLYSDKEMTTEIAADTKVTDNMTVYVKVTVVKLTVTFDTDGGSTIDSVEVEYGAKVPKPADPTKDGKEFDGWDFDFDTVITKNITITAKWKDAAPATNVLDEIKTKYNFIKINETPFQKAYEGISYDLALTKKFTEYSKVVLKVALFDKDGNELKGYGYCNLTVNGGDDGKTELMTVWNINAQVDGSAQNDLEVQLGFIGNAVKDPAPADSVPKNIYLAAGKVGDGNTAYIGLISVDFVEKKAEKDPVSLFDVTTFVNNAEGYAAATTSYVEGKGLKVELAASWNNIVYLPTAFNPTGYSKVVISVLCDDEDKANCQYHVSLHQNVADWPLIGKKDINNGSEFEGETDLIIDVDGKENNIDFIKLLKQVNSADENYATKTGVIYITKIVAK